MIDRGWQILKERLQGDRIVGVKSRCALRVYIERCLLEAFGIAPSEDDAGALGVSSPGGFKPDARAAADDDDSLAEQFRFALGGYCTNWWADHSSRSFLQANGRSASHEIPRNRAIPFAMTNFVRAFQRA